MPWLIRVGGPSRDTEYEDVPGAPTFDLGHPGHPVVVRATLKGGKQLVLIVPPDQMITLEEV